MVDLLSSNEVILGVFPCEQDRAALHQIFQRSPWTLLTVVTPGEACALLERLPIAAILAENRFPAGQSWKDLLDFMRSIHNPPPLIVADRLADERLWAEALNLGAYDVLAKPFQSAEVRHVCVSACNLRLKVKTTQANASTVPL